jgi:hypothetical protein
MKWEYKSVKLPSLTNPRDGTPPTVNIDNSLNAVGEEDWEFVAVAGNPSTTGLIAFLKRPTN